MKENKKRKSVVIAILAILLALAVIACLFTAKKYLDCNCHGDIIGKIIGTIFDKHPGKQQIKSADDAEKKFAAGDRGVLKNNDKTEQNDAFNATDNGEGGSFSAYPHYPQYYYPGHSTESGGVNSYLYFSQKKMVKQEYKTTIINNGSGKDQGNDKDGNKRDKYGKRKNKHDKDYPDKNKGRDEKKHKNRNNCGHGNGNERDGIKYDADNPGHLKRSVFPKDKKFDKGKKFEKYDRMKKEEKHDKVFSHKKNNRKNNSGKKFEFRDQHNCGKNGKK